MKKRLIAIVLVLVLVIVTACTKESTQPDTSPSTSDSETPSVVDTTTPPESEETILPTLPATETFSYESKEVCLKFEFPLSWKDKMQVREDFSLFVVSPPSQDYGVPEKKVYLLVNYIDNPWVYGDTFEKTTSEENIEKIMFLDKSKGDKIIEKSPLKIMDRNALTVTYSIVDPEGKNIIYRGYLINDEKGRCYKVSFPVEREGWEGLEKFAGEAQRVVESMSLLLLTEPATMTFEDKEMGFAFEYPGNWHAYKRTDIFCRITPHIRTYDFPYSYGGINLSYTSPGIYGNSFEELNGPSVLETIARMPVLQVEQIKVGDDQALILRSEQDIPEYSTSFVKTKIMIDAGKGGFYLFEYDSEKGNPAYEPFLAEVGKIIQAFRMTNH